MCLLRIVVLQFDKLRQSTNIIRANITNSSVLGSFELNIFKQFCQQFAFAEQVYDCEKLEIKEFSQKSMRLKYL